MSPSGSAAADDERDATGASVRSSRLRAVAAGISVLAVSQQADTVAMFAAGGLVVAFAAAILVQPGVRDDWRFNVGLAVSFAVSGVAYAATVTDISGMVTGGLVVVLAVLMAGNHLGVAPWSDHPRRI